MAKLIKFFLWFILSLVLVIVAAVILIPVLVDPNDYKDEITRQVYNQTGRTLTIEGNIDLAIALPLSVSLDLGKVELSNAEGFTEIPFAKMQDASLFVSIWPLINENRLEVGKIKLSGMELNLMRNKQGQTNWADLSSEKVSAVTDANNKNKKTQAAPQKASDKNNETNLPEIKIAGINIINAQINWTDEQAGQKISLSKTNITISELIENKPFKLQLSTHIESNNPAIKGDFSLQSAPVISLSKQLFQLPETSLSVDLIGKMLPGGGNKTNLDGDIVFDANAQTLDISKMKLTSYDMTINGLIQASNLDTAVQYTGKVNIEQFSPKTLAAILGSALPEMKEAKALNSADAKMTFTGDENKITISSLEANLDETSLKGSVAISHFKAPHYGFDLTLNQLDLDYYAMAEVEDVAEKSASDKPVSDKSKADQKTKTSKATAKKPQSDTPVFPIEALRQLNLDGKLAIARFIAGGAKMSNVVIVLKGNKGQVQLMPLKADLYKGTINLKTSIDARGKTPKLNIVNELKNVQIGDLLQDVTGSQEFTGVANISANISTSGNDKDRLVKNSNGTAKLLVTDGHIKKLDILTTIRQADALLKGKSIPTESQDENTKFTELKGTMKIKNGVIHNNDLASQSPLMHVTGKGYIDFPKEYVDYTLSVKLLNSMKIDKNSQGTDVKGKEIPYTIKGKFSEISQNANINKVVEKEVKKQIEKELNKQLEKHLGDKFKGLFKF